MKKLVSGTPAMRLEEIEFRIQNTVLALHQMYAQNTPTQKGNTGREQKAIRTTTNHKKISRRKCYPCTGWALPGSHHIWATGQLWHFGWLQAVEAWHRSDQALRDSNLPQQPLYVFSTRKRERKKRRRRSTHSRYSHQQKKRESRKCKSFGTPVRSKALKVLWVHIWRNNLRPEMIEINPCSVV